MLSPCAFLGALAYDMRLVRCRRWKLLIDV